MILAEVSQVTKFYSVGGVSFFESKKKVQALRGVSFSLNAGKTLAVVGESGSGKSTLARLLIGLEKPSSGSLQICENIQMVFQDPHSSLNPRKTVYQSISEPLWSNDRSLTAEAVDQRVRESLRDVGLSEEFLQRYPHTMSGGQKQRVGIARALVTKPKVIVCDEPVSALDVSVQAQVLNLLRDLQTQKSITLVFISHDLHVVRYIADEIAVLYLGKIVEMGSAARIFEQPSHPYTRFLLSSMPDSKGASLDYAAQVQGEIPSPLNPPAGCGFVTRCPFAQEQCHKQMPELRAFADRQSACFRLEEI